MPEDHRRRTGQRGEAAAAEYLRQLGFEILLTNVRTREGELDIIAREGEVLVFVEVRARHGPSYGTAAESVTLAKQRRLMALAEAYLQTLAVQPTECRIDVVAIDFGPADRLRSIELIRNVTG